jgi:glycosyltransferase involved in cell wall biosynthesis
MEAINKKTSALKEVPSASSSDFSGCTVRCMLMQKNESELLPLWIRYHGELFGYQNLFVYDNGSDDRTQEILRAAEKDFGINVDYSKTAPENFENKGAIFAQQISRWSATKTVDYYFPLDCDEFVGIHEAGGYSCCPHSIHRYLSSIKSIQNVAFQVGERLDNSWHDETCFYRIPRARKLFFGNSEVVDMDIGFHNAKLPSEAVVSKIVYFHFHNRPFNLLKKASKVKMQRRLKNFNNMNLSQLRNYQGPGIHLIRSLTCSEVEYANWLKVQASIKTIALRERFSTLNLKIPWVSDASRLFETTNNKPG